MARRLAEEAPAAAEVRPVSETRKERITMSKWSVWIVIGIGIFACLIGGMGAASYNGMVASSNNVRLKWADLQSAYQRRVDLVNQEMPVVTAGAAQELAVFKTLRDQAAALAGTFKYDQFGQPVVPTGADAVKIAEQLGAFDKAFGDFMVYVADNPEIQSTQLFSDFMVQIEGSENRVNVARRDYNTSVTDYRNRVMTFPGNLFAAIFGFNANDFPYFQAAEGAQNAPIIAFPTPSIP